VPPEAGEKSGSSRRVEESQVSKVPGATWPAVAAREPSRVLDPDYDCSVDLIVGGGKLDRRLEHAEELVDAYRTDDGLRYLDYTPLTPPDRLVPEDLAVTILINSRVAGTAFKALQDHGHEAALEALPSCALEDADAGQRQAVCDVICTVVAWPGFAASVATKVLHKKRPALIPILDNEAIFGAYMSPTWPERRAPMDSVYAPTRIREALDWIWFDLNRPENEDVWPALSRSHPSRTRIELFDMAWWMHFRSVQPVARPI
jgi:hypothetical protein